MSISFPSADFAPTLSGYTGQGAFRFWCQKVLPIVYDDSLSYYELLNKVVVYLNNVIKDMQTAGENIDELLEAYKQLEEYVNSYYDIEGSIEEVLDRMIASGKLQALIGPFVPDAVSEWLDKHPDATTSVEDNSLNKTKLNHNDTFRFVTVDCIKRASCNIVMWPNGDFMMIDLGDEHPETTNAIIEALHKYKYDDTTLNFIGLIISHYHHDHIGDYVSLFEAFSENSITVDSEFTVYSQKLVDEWPGWVNDPYGIFYTYHDFLNWCNANGYNVVFPEKTTKYTPHGFEITFANLGMNYYYKEDGGTGGWVTQSGLRYNDTCLCCFIDCGYVCIGCFGDIYSYAQEVINTHDYISQCDIILCPHHGYSTQVSADFMRKLNPKYIIANSGSNDPATNSYGHNSAVLLYCNLTQAELLNTNNGSFCLFVRYDGTFYSDTYGISYNYRLIDYAGLRASTNLGDTENPDLTASSSLETILEYMPKNSKVTCFVTTGYGISHSLNFTSSNIDRAFLTISKFTAGSTNHLSDRSNDGYYYFEIKIVPLDNRGGNEPQYLYGRHRNVTVDDEVRGEFTFYDNGFYDRMLLRVNSSGVISFLTPYSLCKPVTWEEADPSGHPGDTTQAPGKIRLVRPGYYRVTAINPTENPGYVNAFGTIMNLGSVSFFSPKVTKYIVQHDAQTDEDYVEVNETSAIGITNLSRGAGIVNLTTTLSNCELMIEWFRLDNNIHYVPT